jgi:aldose 1-epimerase
MYTLRVEKIGKYEIFCLSDETSNSYVKFVPEKGAIISDLRLNNRNIYDGYESFEDLDSLSWGRGILLAPFPNRLRHGKYSFEGTDYQFPINDKGTGTALHGFISQSSFELGKVETNEKSASVSCHTIYDGKHTYFPFPFKAEVQYKIDDKGEFRMHFSIMNTGRSNMPVGLGWHPYFNLSKKVNDTVLKLPSLDIIEIDKNMIPTGEKNSFIVFESPTKIDHFVLDNCFKLDEESKLAKVVLEGEYGRLTYTQNTDIPYLQVFTPPHRQSIALEPMTCNVDAFNNGDGLKILAPNDIIILECQINLDIK